MANNFQRHLFIESVRAYLGLQEDDVSEIKPDSHPDYKVYWIIFIACALPITRSQWSSFM